MRVKKLCWQQSDKALRGSCRRSWSGPLKSRRLVGCGARTPSLSTRRVRTDVSLLLGTVFSEQRRRQVNVVGQGDKKDFTEEVVCTSAFESRIGFCWVQTGGRERSLDAGHTACSKAWGRGSAWLHGVCRE